MNRLGYLLIGVASVLFITTDADATALLTLMDNQGHYDTIQGAGTSLSLTENGTGAFAGSPWQVSIATGTDTSTSTPYVPGVSLDISATSSGAGVLFGLFSINDLSFGGAPHTVTFNSSLLSSLGTAGVNWEVCVDDANVLGAQSNCSGYRNASVGALSFAPTVTGPFSLTIATRLLASGPSSFNVSTTATDPSTVPEPATLALLGIGLLGIGVGRRRSA